MTERRAALRTPTSTGMVLGLTQRIRYGYSAPVTDLHQRLRTVPPLRHGAQHRRRWEVRVEGASARTRTRTDRWGNVVVDVTVARVDEAVEFVVDVDVDIDVDLGPAGAGRSDGVGEDDGVGRVGEDDGVHRVGTDAAYLRATHLTRPDAAVRALVAGAGDAAEISGRVRRALAYEWGITGVATTAAEALAGGRGVCQDYAHIMLAACRHTGIAARYVSGHLPGEGGSHAWVEVLHPDPSRPGVSVVEGWDPTHDRRTTADYLTVAVGRDYRDAAPLSGSYEGEGIDSTLSVDKQLRRG
jgi:transglutaminase-like putative cysteine protease